MRVKSESRSQDPVARKIEELYCRTIQIVSREIKELSKKSRRQKLDPVQAGDLRGYARLLGDMAKQQKELIADKKAQEEEELSRIPDDQLEAEVRKILKGKKK